MRTGCGSTPEIEAERRRKIAIYHTGRKLSEETKRKISENKKGKPLTEEHKKLLSEIRKDLQKSEDHKQKISESLKGHSVSEEARRKLSKKLSGENNPNFGKVQPPDVIEKRSASLRGRQFTDEHRRNISLSLVGKRSGKNNPMYVGVKNRKYCYRFNSGTRERVRAWFNYTCFECGTPQYSLNEQLGVHHIDYNKDACCDDRKVKMIPLCRSCHAKTNAPGQREYYERYYTELLDRYYGGKCYFSQNEYKLIFKNISCANLTGHTKGKHPLSSKEEIYKYFFFSIHNQRGELIYVDQ